MAVSEAQARATAKYKAKNYKRVPLDLRKQEYDALKEQADSMPMNTFIKKALNAYTGQEIFKV